MEHPLTEMGFSTQLGKRCVGEYVPVVLEDTVHPGVGLRSTHFGTQRSQLDSSSHRLEGYRLQRKKSSRWFPCPFLGSDGQVQREENPAPAGRL